MAGAEEAGGKNYRAVDVKVFPDLPLSPTLAQAWLVRKIAMGDRVPPYLLEAVVGQATRRQEDLRVAVGNHNTVERRVRKVTAPIGVLGIGMMISDTWGEWERVAWYIRKALLEAAWRSLKVG